MNKFYLLISLFLCLVTVGLAQVTVSGRRILVNGSNYQIKGICYAPHAIGAPEWEYDFSKLSQDISMMKAAGINTIRTYRPFNSTSILNAFANAGIKVIIGFTLDETRNGTFANYINTYKNHPAILMWVHGNEFNYHPDWFGGNINNWYSILNQAAGQTRALDPNHPVATVHGELPSSSVINAAPNVQVWGMNIYRGDNHGNLYNDWAARSGKPMFIGETGADSYPDPQAPATAIPRIYNSIKPYLINSSGGIAAGVCFFEWCDEWWKSGNNWGHDTGGFPNGGVPYDGFANEEHWGVVDIYRNAKPAYNALKTAFTGGSSPTKVSVTVEAENYVYMSGVIKETCYDNGGGQNIGAFDAGDWMSYNVNIPSSGTYRISYRVASIYSGRSLTLEKDNGQTHLGTINVPNTGSWQNWTSISHHVTLPAGSYSVGITTSTGGLNLNRWHYTNNVASRIAPEEIAMEPVSAGLLYPNPVKNTLHLDKSFEENSTIEILDLTGTRLKKINLLKGDTQIDMSELAPGAYIIRISNNETLKTRKIYKE